MLLNFYLDSIKLNEKYKNKNKDKWVLIVTLSYSITRLKNSPWRNIHWWWIDSSWRTQHSKSWRGCGKVCDEFLRDLYVLSKSYIHSSQLRRPIMKLAIVFSYYETKTFEKDYSLNDACKAFRSFLPSTQNLISVFDPVFLLNEFE